MTSMARPQVAPNPNMTPMVQKPSSLMSDPAYREFMQRRLMEQQRALDRQMKSSMPGTTTVQAKPKQTFSNPGLNNNRWKEDLVGARPTNPFTNPAQYEKERPVGIGKFEQDRLRKLKEELSGNKPRPRPDGRIEVGQNPKMTPMRPDDSGMRPTNPFTNPAQYEKEKYLGVLDGPIKDYPPMRPDLTQSEIEKYRQALDDSGMGRPTNPFTNPAQYEKEKNLQRLKDLASSRPPYEKYWNDVATPFNPRYDGVDDGPIRDYPPMYKPGYGIGDGTGGPRPPYEKYWNDIAGDPLLDDFIPRPPVRPDDSGMRPAMDSRINQLAGLLGLQGGSDQMNKLLGFLRDNKFSGFDQPTMPIGGGNMYPGSTGPMPEQPSWYTQGGGNIFGLPPTPPMPIGGGNMWGNAGGQMPPTSANPVAPMWGNAGGQMPPTSANPVAPMWGGGGGSTWGNAGGQTPPASTNPVAPTWGGATGSTTQNQNFGNVPFAPSYGAGFK